MRWLSSVIMFLVFALPLYASRLEARGGKPGPVELAWRNKELRPFQTELDNMGMWMDYETSFGDQPAVITEFIPLKAWRRQLTAGRSPNSYESSFESWIEKIPGIAALGIEHKHHSNSYYLVITSENRHRKKLQVEHWDW